MPSDDRSKIHLTSDSVAEKFAEKMRQLELSAKEREVEAHAKTLGVGYINLKGFPIGPETLSSIPREQSESLKVVCFLNTETEVRVGALDPESGPVKELVYQLGERHHADARVYAISEESFHHASKLYDALPQLRVLETGVKITEADLERFKQELTNLKVLEQKIREASISDLVTLIIAGSINARSSDIHIEAEEKQIALRYRIDGVLRQVASIPKDLWPRLISRMKLLSGLKLNVSDIPQDGRFTIALKHDKIDVRVSTLPTAWGESVVMRLLMSSVAGLQFEQLGVRGRAQEQLKTQVERPNGMIITTGPTGSGKSTTLYAVLNKLNDPETKIITLEDPVEFKIAGVNQSQIDPSREYTFAKGLRAILRQDPDVVMVGEIRDLETAEVAIQAALTGHLMLSTIHTNSAAGAIPRFLSMGVKPFLLAPALNAVIGQRLVRRIHEDCKVEDQLSPELLERVKSVVASLPEDERKAREGKPQQFWKGKGCEGCHDTGYRGRMGIYEVFAMSKEIETIILGANVSEYQMQEIAVKQGMVTMVQDGILKALDGITTAEEVFSVAE
ncbi:type II/IV secretion system protein [Candidatus Uhrbacteria bacterium]|nr:type II/IV secretion system protein [Candidatus Uhrbacteria bacterium]